MRKTKRAGKSVLKRYDREDRSGSMLECSQALRLQITVKGSARPDWDQIAQKQTHNVFKLLPVQKKRTAFVNGIGERDLGNILLVRLGNLDAGKDQRNKVEKDQSCEDLLNDVFTLDTVEEIHASPVFHKEERSLDLPAEMVQFFEL